MNYTKHKYIVKQWVIQPHTYKADVIDLLTHKGKQTSTSTLVRRYVVYWLWFVCSNSVWSTFIFLLTSRALIGTVY